MIVLTHGDGSLVTVFSETAMKDLAAQGCQGWMRTAVQRAAD
jgi:hypothetical protein